MNKEKIVIYIALVLIIVNTAFLVFGFFVPKHPPHSKKEGPKNVIIEKLNFNEKQITDYEALIPEHRENVFRLEKVLRKNRQMLYNTLTKNEVSKDSILNEIGKKQIEIEKVHLKHFEQIKEICTPKQIPAFEDLIQEIEEVFNSKRRPNKNKH